jgi:hypothetical protein
MAMILILLNSPFINAIAYFIIVCHTHHRLFGGDKHIWSALD